MTDDQQFILALVAVVSSAVGQVLNYRKTSQTHTLVNGMTKTNTRRSRAAAVHQERERVAADDKTAAEMAPRQLQNKPGPRPGGYGST